MNENKVKLTGLSIVPIMLLFGYLLSNIGIRTLFIASIAFLLLMGYILYFLKYEYTNIVLLFLVFFIWGTILFLKGQAEHKIDSYISFFLALFIIAAIYYYALYTNIYHFQYYIYIFIFASFIIAVFEVNFNLILPSSGKNFDEVYKIDFKNVPTSTFFNPNDFATAIGMIFVYIYSYCKIMKKYIRFFILFCCIYIIYFTGSRGVLIAVMLLPLVYSLVNKKSFIKTVIIYSFFSLTAVSLFSFTSISGYTVDKYLSTISAVSSGALDSSSLYRWQMIFYTFTHLNDLVIGFGPGGSAVFLAEFPISNPHNFFMEVLIDYGFIGLALCVSIFFTSLRMNYRLIKLDVTRHLRASCKATIILTYLFILFSVVSSSLLVNWPFAWLPVYLTVINLGVYKRQSALVPVAKKSLGSKR